MNIGFIGLGKLGLPVALGIESKGHKVRGFDINPEISNYLKQKTIPFKEEGIQPLLDNNKIKLSSLDKIVKKSDIIFAAPQTPHAPQYEGATRIPQTRADFDYTFLKDVVSKVAESAKTNKKRTTLVIISTCLPGTYTREIKPLLNEYIDYIYNPFFIAMGTVLKDFFNPEFVLLGGGSEETRIRLTEFYKSIHNKELFFTDITTAEAIKVSYNTFITTKTVLANLWGELAFKTGANVDDITKAWSMATDRLMSPKYLSAGMGDGGGCHPRDNIALSYIAEQAGLSFNFFEVLMMAREKHAEWLADMAIYYSEGYPIVVLGRSFKPETNIETGSPSRLVANIIREKGFEPIHVEDIDPNFIGLYLIGTKHSRYKDYHFKEGSMVLDPFGYIPDKKGIGVVRIGRK